MYLGIERHREIPQQNVTNDVICVFKAGPTVGLYVIYIYNNANHIERALKKKRSYQYDSRSSAHSNQSGRLRTPRPALTLHFNACLLTFTVWLYLPHACYLVHLVLFSQ